MNKLPDGYIHHHTLFQRRVFEQKPYSKAWRRNSGMIIIMPRDDEQELHRELDSLPLPSENLARCALSHLESLPKDWGRVQKFLSTIALLRSVSGNYLGTDLGHEAHAFALNLEDQESFMDSSLTAAEERILNKKIR